MPLMWQVTIDGKSLRLEDIDIGVLGTIARKYDGDWTRLVYYPFSDDRSAKELIIKCAEILGVDPPAPVDGEWPARVMLDLLETVPDDLPDNLDSDGLPTKAEADDPPTV